MVPKCPGLHAPSALSGSAAGLQPGASAPLLSAPRRKSSPRTLSPPPLCMCTCVCAQVCVCLCMPVCGRAHEYMGTHVWCVVCARLSCVRACVGICAQVCCMCMHTCLDTCMCESCAHVCASVCMHVYICSAYACACVAICEYVPVCTHQYHVCVCMCVFACASTSVPWGDSAQPAPTPCSMSGCPLCGSLGWTPCASGQLST